LSPPSSPSGATEYAEVIGIIIIIFFFVLFITTTTEREERMGLKYAAQPTWAK
jgi:hypothetical protein